MVCYFSAAETNFFLAEFTLLGATWNGQKSAQEYFTDGITASVKDMIMLPVRIIYLIMTVLM
mgnify:FL=1